MNMSLLQGRAWRMRLVSSHFLSKAETLLCIIRLDGASGNQAEASFSSPTPGAAGSVPRAAGAQIYKTLCSLRLCLCDTRVLAALRKIWELQRCRCKMH